MSDEKQNPWKAAIIQELIVDNILTEELERDPHKALAAAIDWNCKVALDPSVSKEAMELQQQAIDAALESVADLLDSGDDWNTGDEIAEFIRSRIGTNPLAERDRRIAELERELSEQANAIAEEVNKCWPQGKPPFVGDRTFAVAGTDEVYTEYGDAPQVTDKGPWTPSDDGRHIQSEDFEHDVTLRVSGDFATDEDRIAYTKWLAAKLNATPQVPDGMVLVPRELYEAWIGLCYGTDWNNGTHAKKYRKKIERLIAAAKEEADETKPAVGPEVNS